MSLRLTVAAARPPRRHSLFKMNASAQHQSRAWVFTLNNYTQDHETLLQHIDCQYIVYGREVGTSGTPHLQGYVYFATKLRKQGVARRVPNAYLAPRNGTHEEARNYCIKDGDFFERGEPPLSTIQRSNRGGSATAAKWKEIQSASARGDLGWIADNHPKEFVLYKPRLESLYAPVTAPLDGELLHEWWVGPSGTGKSRALWALYPTHFAKSINKWWDGYRHETVVAIEEWSPDSTLTAQALKKWADRYPFTGEIKGGVLQKLRPKKIIVLSNYTPDQCFTRVEDLEPIKRRFTVIKFPEEIQRANFRAAWFNAPPEVCVEESEESEESDVSSIGLIDDLPDLDFLDKWS